MSRRWSSPVGADRIPNPSSHPSYANPAPPVSEEDPTKHVHFSTKAPSLSITIPPVSPSMDVPVLTEAQQRAMTLTGLSFAAASGALSGMSLVLAKAAVELLVITIDHYRTGKGENQFVRAQSWFLVVGLGVGAVLQLVYLNYSLTFASPALICPLAFCFFNLSSIFGELFVKTTYSLILTARWTCLLRPIWPTRAVPNRASVNWRPGSARRRVGSFGHTAWSGSRCRYLGRGRAVRNNIPSFAPTGARFAHF